MDKQIVENDLMNLCFKTGGLKMRTSLCFKNTNQKFGKEVYNVQKSNKKNRLTSFDSKCYN